MRFIYFLFLLAFVAAVAIFAFQNSDVVTVRFLQWGATSNFSLFIAGAYLLGMVSGWTVIGFVRRTFETVTTPAPPRRA